MGIAIPKPFSQPICLVPDTRIAGPTCVDDIDELAPGLSVGERLALVCEKDNRYDEWCIRVDTSAGGKALYAEVNKVEKVDGWWKIGMGVWLDD